MFTGLCGAIGALLHRALWRLWDACLGDIAAEGAAALKTYVRTRKVWFYYSLGFLPQEDAQRLMREIVEADVRSGLPSPKPKPRLPRGKNK